MKSLRYNQAGFGHIELVLIVVIVGLFGFIGWRVYEAKKPKKQLSIEQIIVDYEKNRGGFPELSVKDYQSKDKNDQIYAPYVAYTADNSQDLGAAQSNHWMHLSGKADVIQSMLDVQAQRIAASLQTNGFSLDAHPPINITSSSFIQNPPYGHAANGYYVSKDTVCLLGSSAALVTTGTSQLYLDCVGRAAITKAAAEVKGFVQPYKDYVESLDIQTTDRLGERHGLPVMAYFYRPVIKASTNSAYQYAEVNARAVDYNDGFNARALFYKKSSDKHWKFAGATQQGLFCKDLPDADAKQALAGVCLPDNAQL